MLLGLVLAQQAGAATWDAFDQARFDRICRSCAGFFLPLFVVFCFLCFRGSGGDRGGRPATAAKLLLLLLLLPSCGCC